MSDSSKLSDMPDPERDVEEIDVPDVPEPETPEEGAVDPDDDYTEGHG